MNRFLAGAAALILMAGVGAAAPAAASQPGPGAASSSTSCTDITGNDVSCTQGGTLASVQLQPFVLLSASANGGAGLNATAVLDYDFQVLGSNTGDTVTLGVNTHMITNLSGSGSSFAQFVY
jgi:hypothetical protein